MRSTTLDFSQLGDAQPWLDNASWDRGNLVYRFGVVFVAVHDGVTSDPISPANRNDWLAVPTIQELVRKANTAEPLAQSSHPINDLNDIGYLNNLRINRLQNADGKVFNFYLVHPDGTQITGDATLEAIFDPGGAGEYPYLSTFAEEALGDWTLKDLAGTFPSAQTSGGERDTVGEVLDDQMQRITGSVKATEKSVAIFGLFASVGDEGALFSAINENKAPDLHSTSSEIKSRVRLNSGNSPNARASATTDGETRARTFVAGLPGIVVMKEENA